MKAQTPENMMTTNWIVYACLAVGLSSALVAGVFQSFSDFVMKALIIAEPAGGIEAMQMINRTVFRSVFLGMLLGLVPITLGFAAYAYFNLSGPVKLWIMSGAAIYLMSVFFVTMFGNVPMNNRLEAVNYETVEAINYWRIYGRVWTNWNHIRTFGSAATAICFLLASAALT
jgi:uncharacterized membrane protein